MKKMLLGLIVLGAFGFNANAKAHSKEQFSAKSVMNVSTNNDGDDFLKIKIHLEWGRKSRACQGFGICSADIDIDTEGAFFGSVNANGNLVLEVTKIGMQSITKKFNSSIIIIEEDFTLSDVMCQEVGLKSGYTIKQGKYAVKSDGTGAFSVIL